MIHLPDRRANKRTDTEFKIITLPISLLMAQPNITFEKIQKTYNKVLAEYGIVRNGTCLMSDAKRAELRKKRKKKKKK